jgi:hypothetical protein
MAPAKDVIPTICLSDEPGAAVMVSGPCVGETIASALAGKYIVRVVNGEKTLAAVLTKEQIAELWFFVRSQFCSPPERADA